MSKQRYEKEIEEILRKYDEESGRKERPLPRDTRDTRATRAPLDLRPISPPRGVPRPPGKQFTMPNWKRLSAGQYILMAFGVALLAVLLRNLWGPLTFILILISAILFLVPILLYYNTGTTSGGYSSHEEKRWRGQVIDFNTRRDVTGDPLAGIKRWLRRK
jgi:hypothetical protein